MDHDQATEQMIIEKYLLDELSPELREEFEEHFFSCPECARDLQAGAVFIEHSKAILLRAPGGPEPSAERSTKKGGWLDWLLRPRIAVPVMAVLLATIAYLALAPNVKPQVLSAVFINVGGRGGNTPAITVERNQGFLLRLNLPPDRDYSSATVNIDGPDGKLSWSLKLPTSIENDTYFVQIPPGHHLEGSYSVAVTGITSTGAAGEIGRSTFDLHVRE